MEAKKVFLLAAGFFLSLRLWGFDVSLAPLFQYSPDGNNSVRTDITQDLYNAARKKDEAGIMSLSVIKTDSIPRSILEAADLSEKENRAYILYGFLKVTPHSYDLEIKLYDREAGKIEKIFYAKTASDEYEELVSTMAERITDYVYTIYGAGRRKREAETEHGVIRTISGLGYWLPMEPWSDSLAGLGFVYAGAGITPSDPLFTHDIFRISVSYGIELGYVPGTSREGYEEFFLHRIRLGFPVSILARWYERNLVFIRVSAGLETAILSQERKYSGTVTADSECPVVCAGAGYEYLFSESRYSTGIMIGFEAALYDPVLYTFSPSLYVRYRIR